MWILGQRAYLRWKQYVDIKNMVLCVIKKKKKSKA